MKQPAGLISVLLDATARIDERDDAAMDLAGYDTPETEAALALVGCDLSVDEIVRESCRESLADIWAQRGVVNDSLFCALFGAAKHGAQLVLKSRGLAMPPSN